MPEITLQVVVNSDYETRTSRFISDYHYIHKSQYTDEKSMTNFFHSPLKSTLTIFYGQPTFSNASIFASLVIENNLAKYEFCLSAVAPFFGLAGGGNLIICESQF